MDNNYYGNICYCRRCNGIVHTIKRGDSLYLLSRHYNVPIGEIMNANRNLNVYNLQIGQEICIPMSRGDMMNDSQETMMPRDAMDSSMMRDNMMNTDMTNNDMMSDNMLNNNMMDNNMTNNTMTDNTMTHDSMMNRNMMSGTSLTDAEASTHIGFSATSFDTSVKMSELLQRDDMTFETFRDLMAEYLK